MWGVLALVFVGSGLLARRIAVGPTLRMAAAWVAVFALVFVLFLFQDAGRVVWDRAKSDIYGKRIISSGGTVRVPMAEDGHFWVDASVNGRDVRFLIDSGATTTGLSSDVAAACDVLADSSIPIATDTANGEVEVYTAQIASLRVGSIRQNDAKAVIGKSFGNTNVLGMSFLSSLKSWHVESNTLILTPSSI